MKTSRILFIIALILSFGMQAEAKKVKLEYKLKAGDQFKYERSVTQDIVQEMMGQAQNTTAKTAMTYDFKVTEVTTTGDFVINVAMVAFLMETNSPVGEMKYNSATDTVVPDFAKSMAVMMNETYTMTLSPMGKISNAKVPEGLTEKVNKMLEGLGDQQMQISASAMGASAEGFQKMMEGFIIAMPEGGAALKEPWEVESKVNQVVSLNTKTKYELLSSGKETNEIKVSSQITQDPDAPPMEIQGMNITYDLLGANDGTISLSAPTGLILSSQVTTSISGTISIESPQLPSPMSIPMTIRSSEKITKL